MESTKKPNKRVVDGFTPENIHDRIKLINRFQTKGNWRRTGMIKIPYTEIIQEWTDGDSGESVEIWTLCPWGMHNSFMKLLSSDKCKNSFNVVPKIVIDKLNLTKESFTSQNINLSAKFTGVKPAKDHHYIYCCHCKKELLPNLLETYKEKLPHPTLEGLISQWDTLQIPDMHRDIVGCFISLNPNVKAGPNARRFLERPTEHPQCMHPETVVEKLTKAGEKRSTKVQKTLSFGSSPPPKKLTVASSSTITSPSSSKNQLTLTGKHGKKMKFRHVGSLLDPKLGVTEKCSDDMDRFGKGLVLSVVQGGVNQCLSNEAIINNYQIAINAMKSYYNFMTQSKCNVELAPPVTISVNKNNISTLEECLLFSYRYDNPNSLFTKLSDSPYWGIMHDGINKFNTEFNGVFLRGIDQAFEPFVVPFRLDRMKGGVNAHDLVEALIINIAEVNSLKETAYTSIHRMLEGHINEEDGPGIRAPEIFKLGTVGSVDHTKCIININISDPPIGNCGDGVSVNEKAARVLRELYGLNALSFRCAAHSSDGTLKRMARSETMCVSQVKALYDCMKPVVKHFASSSKSKELLDSAMEMIELTPIHMINWGATRMAHFLEACALFSDIIVAVYDTMYSNEVRKEERDKLFSSENLYVIMLIKDIRDIFVVKYLRAVDTTNLLVTTVFKIAGDTASAIRDVETLNADKFMDSIFFDENGNTMVELTVQGNKHKLKLSNSHRPNRNITEEERLERAKQKLTDIKAEVLLNVEENIRDQCSEATNYFSWSGLDLAIRGISLNDRIQRLEPIITWLCTDRIHVVQKYVNARETELGLFTWNNYEIHLHYSKKIQCNYDEFISEFRKAWGIINGLWMTETIKSQKEKRQPNQLKTWQKFLENHAVEFLLVAQFIMVMISTPPNTSPLERGYTHLQRICEKRRNRLSADNIENLFLLAMLKLEPKDPTDYDMEINRLEK